MRRLLMTTMLVTGFALSAINPAGAKDFTKDEIEAIIKDYILKNPQVMIESVNNFEKEQRGQETKKFDDVIKSNSDWLYKNKDHAEAGNPKGDVTVVEFFDYNCGYCKQALNDLLTLLDEDKELRIVFVEIPILGESSFEAARWALAANKQERYLEFHVALMRHKGALDAAMLEEYAKKAGLDVDKIKAELVKGSAGKILDENLDQSRAFGISGTPAFIVGEETIRGYIGLDGMRQVIAEARKNK